MVPDAAPPPPDAPVTHEIGKRTYVVADVDPLDVDGVRTVAVGTAAWLVAFVGLLPFYDRLREDGHLWWLWTCLAGFGLGLAGWDYCRRRRRHRLDHDDVTLPPVLDLPADPPLAQPVTQPVTQPVAPPVSPPPAQPGDSPKAPPAKPPFMPGARDVS